MVFPAGSVPPGTGGIPLSSPELSPSWVWAVKEATVWLAARPDRGTAYRKFREFNERQDDVVLLTLADGDIEIADKSPRVTTGVSWRRAEMYAGYLREVARTFCPRLRCELLVDIGDARRRNDSVPVFGFQKPIGYNELLLPDVDFFHFDFYDTYPDLRNDAPFAEKSCSAMFVGASSGGYIDAEVVRTLSLPRLRAAARFRDNPLVSFKVTSLVQYDTEETKRALEEAGFGGNPVPLEEQFGHKFLISMDGNGATCSRVVIALKSNSVLLKYESPHELYYFPGLQRWTHYIPIYSDDDIIRVVEAERRRPGLFQPIAEAGRRFANTHLTRFSTMRYTAWLLELYNSAFLDAEPHHVPVPAQYPEGIQSGPDGPLAEILVHIQNVGDVRFKPGGWIGDLENPQWIEGLAIETAPGVPRTDVEYTVVFADGTSSNPSMGGEFAGSRQKTAPIVGFSIGLRGAAEKAHGGSYEGLFMDGSTTGPCPFGSVCVSSGERVPLRALRISFARGHV